MASTRRGDRPQPRAQFADPLSIPGLDDETEASPALSHALAGYVRQVAAAVGVPAEAVGYEVTDTATAYVGLADRWSEEPGRDLMLAWDERLGWYVAVETAPGESPLVIGRLVGDFVPSPAAVARFVSDVVAGQHPNRISPVPPTPDRLALARRMVAMRQLDR